MLSYKEFLQKINEGLIKTHDLGSAQSVLSKWFNSFGLNFDISINKLNNTLNLNIYYTKHLDLKFFDELLHWCTTLGYFPSEYIGINSMGLKKKFKTLDDLLANIQNTNSLYITLEGKFDQTITNVPKLLYHVTNSNLTKSIQYRGLRVKSRKKIANHPNRIYLLLDNNYQKIVNGFKRIDFFNSENNTYDLFEINFEKLNEYKKKDIRLYTDPNFLENGCWIYENIPPEFIKNIKTNI